MAFQIVGPSGIIMGVGAEAAKGAHVILKPDDHATLGHYRLTVTTGILPAALAASAVVFSFRWGSTTRFCKISRVRTKFLPLTAFTAATLNDSTSFDLFFATGFTAAHTGGTGLTLTGRNNKVRTSMGTSLATDMRIATTAALGGGTLTLDTQAIDSSLRKANRVNPAAATEETIVMDPGNIDYLADQGAGEHPIILAQDEGIVIRNRTVWPAAGTGQLQVTIAWSELTVY